VASARPTSNNQAMQSLFPYVVFGGVGLSLLMSLVFLVSNGSVYDEIGQNGFEGEGEPAHVPAFPERPMPSDLMLTRTPEAQQAEREQEIRQMLQARSERRVRRGEPALDIDAELAALTAEPVSAPQDPGIAEEVLQLVVARNERRQRQGLEPLDVEAEVARTMAELYP
jgi:hypothetical protein